jgi:hypothetical protein
MPKPPRGKKFYTIDEANAMLPLLRVILRDITELACSLRERHERLAKVAVPAGHYDEPHDEEFDRDQERLAGYMQELQKLKVELKDPFIGLVDFPCWRDNREVLLCWKLGEPNVTHWHELDAGFAGRKKVTKFLK